MTFIYSRENYVPPNPLPVKLIFILFLLCIVSNQNIQIKNARTNSYLTFMYCPSLVVLLHERGRRSPKIYAIAQQTHHNDFGEPLHQ